MSIRTDIDAASLWLLLHRNPGLSREEQRDSLGWSDSKLKRRERDLRDRSVTLTQWIRAMEMGFMDLFVAEKTWWYEQIPHLMMIGTPPWTPSDYVDITPTLMVVVPTGATIQEYEKPIHRRPVYEQ